MPRQTELFSTAPPDAPPAHAPLAERMRPRSLDAFRGQRHLLGPGGPLRRMADRRRLDSLVLWGPPGCGKTTLAALLASCHDGAVASFSAVLHGVRELRAVVEDATQDLRRHGRPTLVVVDEIHRFSKAQQDAFLPHVERGTIVLLGATTENPSFEIIAPLLSRVRVMVLEPLADGDLEGVLDAALADTSHGLGGLGLTVTEDARDAIVKAARGDARIALGILESAASFARDEQRGSIDHEGIRSAMSHRPLAHDKAGDAHYDLLSAYVKSMRGSDPDAAVYWLMRMLEAGEDPLVLARRLVVFAAEDVGLADPDALQRAVAAKDAVHFLGLPEGAIPLAAATIHLACAPRSNAAHAAMRAAADAVRAHGALAVPLWLRNAPTALGRALGHGRGYRSPHDDPDAGADESHLPPELSGLEFYQPTDRGWEGSRREDVMERRRRRRR